VTTTENAPPPRQGGGHAQTGAPGCDRFVHSQGGDDSGPGFETLAVHAGQEPDPATGAVVVPIHPATTFAQDGIGGLRAGFEYGRSGNPTRAALEVSLAALEGGRLGFAFSSGLAAEDALLRAVCRPGDHALIPADAYGGTYRLFQRIYADWGLEFTPVDLSDLTAVRAALRPGPAVPQAARTHPGPGARTRLVWCETPTNPLLSIADIAALAELTHAAGALLAVDNTFASPCLQRPLALGADAVVHSTTKYLGGHSDVIGGAVIVADEDLGERVRFVQNAAGAVPSPFDAWLVLRGIRTLPVRMDRHCANAAAVAELLAGHPSVGEVRYPGLPSHPGHAVAARQMAGYGGMVSFRVRGGAAAAAEVCRAARLFTLAESLGGVESLIEHPGRMTHASVAGSPLAVPDDLIRLSVGIESADDLLADLAQALAAAG
jgi:cystathionine gamma-synthase